MVNVTQYLKDKGIYNNNTIKNFKRSVRVKYLIKSRGLQVESKAGRHHSGNLFSEELFEIFLSWMQKEPIPLLNRKEYEINDFISTYYKDSISQHKVDSFVFDWYIPCKNLLIEFNETTHVKKYVANNDKKKAVSAQPYNYFIINENSAMIDLAELVKKYPI